MLMCFVQVYFPIPSVCYLGKARQTLNEEEKILQTDLTEYLIHSQINWYIHNAQAVNFACQILTIFLGNAPPKKWRTSWCGAKTS